MRTTERAEAVPAPEDTAGCAPPIGGEGGRGSGEALRSIRAPEHRRAVWWHRLRRPAAWAAVVLVLAGVPLVALLLVALLHVFRGPVVRAVVPDPPGAGVPGPATPAFPDMVALLTGAPLEAGNRVEILSNGDETFPRLWSDLREARRSITVQIYYIGPGAVIDSVTRLLAERARSGVAVYFLYDAFGGQDFPSGNLARLRAAGVRTAEFRPLRWYALDRANHRLHVRGIVIDGVVGYTGGFGFDDKWLGGGRQPAEWRDTNVRMEGPAAARLQGGFVAHWAEATGELVLGDRFLPPDPSTPSGTVEATLLHSPPVTGSTSAERLLVLSIASARRRLYVTNPYFVPQENFVRMLADAARRGVDVRILTNGRRSDVRVTQLAGRSVYESLLEAGVRIYEYGPSTLHAKTLVVDGLWSAITTMNVDNRSLAYNSEVALLALDARTGTVLDSLFVTDLRAAEEIQLSKFRRRPWTERLLERSARLLASLL